jgi:hypothetical protein
MIGLLIKGYKISLLQSKLPYDILPRILGEPQLTIANCLSTVTSRTEAMIAYEPILSNVINSSGSSP